MHIYFYIFILLVIVISLLLLGYFIRPPPYMISNQPTPSNNIQQVKETMEYCC